MAVNHTRRKIILASMSSLGLWTAGGAVQAAARLIATPQQTPGPFYPLQFPDDVDNDLITVRGRKGTAKGDVCEIQGIVMDRRGNPVPKALVEIWQVDSNGNYHHPHERHNRPADYDFQGYGRYTTGNDGIYRFRTIKPVPYFMRAPHIHFAIRAHGFKPLATQMYFAGEPDNQYDAILNGVRDAQARDKLIVKVEKKAKVLQGQFNIVLS
jgi:protocatechuate 3,4-dioxygenase beta subunit